MIGSSVRRLRLEAGLRADDVARAARSWGFAWNRSKISELERGDKSISGEELVLLPSILSTLLEREVSLHELLDDPRRVQLSDEVNVPARQIKDLIAAAPWPPEVDVTFLRLESVFKRADGAFRRAKILGLIPRGALQQLLKVERTQGDAEVRAARQLHEPVVVVTAASSFLWGQSLTSRRNELVDERSGADASANTLRAMRGRVTRELTEQIRELIESREQHGSRR